MIKQDASMTDIVGTNSSISGVLRAKIAEWVLQRRSVILRRISYPRIVYIPRAASKHSRVDFTIAFGFATTSYRVDFARAVDFEQIKYYYGCIRT